MASLSEPASAKESSRDSSPSRIVEDHTAQQPSDVEKSVPATSGPDPNAPPDGGLSAWTTVLGGFCCVFASFGWINCIGVFQDYYQHHQLAAYSPSTIAWIPSTESFMMFFMGPLVGKMTDDLGPRIPILIGSFLHVFGLMMTSLAKEYYQILLAQIFPI
ncbi:hypothetical protein NQ176_g5629 [Zarea fungicola]|uniref:Uncharacterized protein n=1 Tax=Zarea fungicola TaxID=93591 RepID=A0ACC1N8Y4_9HYPO|nr:hypothetical protein NQ176_g5629 [Lecanicillium fungicola]